MISYFVPINDNGDAASYNIQAYENGTKKQKNWLTPDEYYSRFPQQTIPEEVPTLEFLKASKKEAIDANTNRIRNRDGLAFGGERFAMTEGAKLNWTGMLAAASMLSLPMNILTIEDKPFEIIDQAALMAFLMAVMAYDTAPGSPITTGRELRTRVEAATTIEEVEAIVDDRA